MTKYVPLQVRAHLAAGIAQASPWGIALDGILAAELWAAQKATWLANDLTWTRARDHDNPPDLDLPLARCELADGLWHWAATSALPEGDPSRTDIHTWTGRTDARDLEQVAVGLPQVVSERQGRWRARRMPLLVSPCRSVTWQAVGDPIAIRGLVEGVGSIGKKRTSGEGQVLSWEVTVVPGLDPVHAAHLHADGTLGRPTPTACLTHLPTPLQTGGTGRAGLRPPYIHPSRQMDLHLPALLDR